MSRPAERGRAVETDGANADHGDAGDSPEDATGHAWSTLVDARAQVEAAATSLRKNLLLTAAVLVLAAIVLDRFLFLARELRMMVYLLPAALLVAGAGIDLAWYRRRDQELVTRIEHLEEGHPDGQRLREARGFLQRRPMPRLGLALF